MPLTPEEKQQLEAREWLVSMQSKAAQAQRRVNNDPLRYNAKAKRGS